MAVNQRFERTGGQLPRRYRTSGAAGRSSATRSATSIAARIVIVEYLMDQYYYDIAFSYAGDDRQFAFALSQRLDAAGFSVFFDQFELARLWGNDLADEFAKIYGERSRFCLMIISCNYVAKVWPKYEARFAISRMLQDRPDYVLPVRLDDSQVPGLPFTTGYLDARVQSLEDIYALLLRKLGKPRGPLPHAIDARSSLAWTRKLQLAQCSQRLSAALISFNIWGRSSKALNCRT